MYSKTRNRYIYHYTSLSSLAMILSNKTLRLFPLSNMDDLQEEKSREVKNYGRFIFVSSWTKERTESIPMWKMYSRPAEGVRIGLKENPFKVFDFNKGGFRELNEQEEQLNNGLKAACEVVSPLICSEFGIRNPLYETQLVEVKYNNDQNLLFPDVLNKEFALDGNKMGITKNTNWKFQKEIRYRIIAYIKELDQEIKLLSNSQQEIARLIDNIIEKYIDRLPPYIDLHLSDKAINQMKITVAPDFTEENMVLLDALIEKYVPFAQISRSELTNIVKLSDM